MAPSMAPPLHMIFLNTVVPLICCSGEGTDMVQTLADVGSVSPRVVCLSYRVLEEKVEPREPRVRSV